MYCGLSVKKNMHKTLGREDHGRISFAFVSACVVSTKPEYPNWSSMAGDGITLGGIGVLGSLFYSCDLNYIAQRVAVMPQHIYVSSIKTFKLSDCIVMSHPFSKWD